MHIDQLKKLAAEKAVEEISSGMIVGLGTGSTVRFALEKIFERIKNGELKNILCIPSSLNTEKEATRLGIPLATFDEIVKRRENEEMKSETENGEVKSATGNQKSIAAIRNNSILDTLHSSFCLDVTIDGADEADQSLNLIKGGGGALLREKVLAQASKNFIVIVDESKISKFLGTKWHVPVEVLQFAVSVETKYLESLGAKVVKRKNADGSDYITDESNSILDADFGEITNPEELSNLLNKRAGIAEHGLFVGLTSKLICAMKDGLRITER